MASKRYNKALIGLLGAGTDTNYSFSIDYFVINSSYRYRNFSLYRDNIFVIQKKCLLPTFFFSIYHITLTFISTTLGLANLRFLSSQNKTLAIFIFMAAEIAKIFPPCYYPNKFMETTDRMYWQFIHQIRLTYRYNFENIW